MASISYLISKTIYVLPLIVILSFILWTGKKLQSSFTLIANSSFVSKSLIITLNPLMIYPPLLWRTINYLFILIFCCVFESYLSSDLNFTIRLLFVQRASPPTKTFIPSLPPNPPEGEPMSDSSTIIQQLKASVEQFKLDRNWSHYHTPQDLAVSISIEAAELLEIFPWGIRGTNVNQEKLARVKEELAPLLSKHSKPPPRPFSRALIAFLTKNIYSSPADKNRCKCRLTRIPERFSLAIERTHIQFLYKPVISRGFFVGLGDTRGDMGEGGRLVF